MIAINNNSYTIERQGSQSSLLRREGVRRTFIPKKKNLCYDKRNTEKRKVTPEKRRKENENIKSFILLTQARGSPPSPARPPSWSTSPPSTKAAQTVVYYSIAILQLYYTILYYTILQYVISTICFEYSVVQYSIVQHSMPPSTKAAREGLQNVVLFCFNVQIMV